MMVDKNAIVIVNPVYTICSCVPGVAGAVIHDKQIPGGLWKGSGANPSSASNVIPRATPKHETTTIRV